MFISKSNFVKNVSLAWPLALNSILVQSMVIVDLMLIAPLGEIPVTALGIASAILAFLIGIQFALANGTQMLVARAVGVGSQSLITKTLVAGLLINVGFSCLTFLALISGSTYLLGLVSDNPMVVLEAQRYIHVSMFLLLISSFTQVMIVYFNGSGQTKIPMRGFMIEIPVNIMVSTILIYGYVGLPELGLQGAAVGSLAGIVVRCIYLGMKISRESNLEFMTGLWSVHKKDLSEHFIEVYPIAANFVTLTGGMMVYQLLFAQLDIYAYAAIALVMPWMRMGAQFVNAWSHATSINISQHLGREEFSELPEFVPQAIRITNLLAIVTCFAFLLFSFAIPSIYPSMSEETLRALSIIAPIYILMPLLRTYNTVCAHSLRALGMSFQVLRVHVITQWLISLPLLVLLIYLKAPLVIVFGVTLFEEALKVFSFRKNLKLKLKSFAQEA